MVLLKLVAVLLLARSVASQINIQLQANWENPPFALRLLETVSSENEQYYLQSVAAVTGIEIDEDSEAADALESYTDEQLYESVFDLLTPQERALYDIPLVNKYYSPRVISHYQYYRNVALPSFESKLQKKCGEVPQSWIQYNDVVYCKADDVFALMTDGKQGSIDDQLLPFDRVIGDSGPLLIFYGDISDPNLKGFLQNLYESSQGGKFRFVWRYSTSTDPADAPKEILNGFGVDLTLKRTDYIVIDDRDLTGGQQKPLKSEQRTLVDSDSFLDQYSEDIPVLSKSDLEELDLKLASFALSEKNDTLNFNNLLKAVQDLPKFTSDLSTFTIDEELVQQIQKNAKLGLPFQESSLFLNGLALAEDDQNIFALYKAIKKELEHVNRLTSLGIDSNNARTLIEKFCYMSLKKNVAVGVTRYKVESETSPIIYFNDVETDPAYQDLGDDVSVYLQMYRPGNIPPLRSNIHSLVFAIDLTNREHLRSLMQTLEAVKYHLIPQRIGVIPLISTEDDQLLANNLFHIVETQGVSKAQKYLKKLQSHSGKPKKLTDRNYTLDLVDPFISSFDVRQPSIIANGVFYALDENWPYSLTKQVTDDVRAIGYMIYEGKVKTADDIIEALQKNSSPIRDSVLVPDDKNTLEHIIVTSDFIEGSKKLSNEIFEFTNKRDDETGLATFTLGGNLGSKMILEQLVEVLNFVKDAHINLKVRIINTSNEASFIGKIRQALNKSIPHAIEVVEQMLEDNQFIEGCSTNPAVKSLLRSIGVDSESGFILYNGRYVKLPDYVFSSKVLDFFASTEFSLRIVSALEVLAGKFPPNVHDLHDWFEIFSSVITKTYFAEADPFAGTTIPRLDLSVAKTDRVISFGDKTISDVHLLLTIDPTQELSQKLLSLVQAVKDLDFISVDIVLTPKLQLEEFPVKRFYRGNFKSRVEFSHDGSLHEEEFVSFDLVPENTLFTLDLDVPPSWIVIPKESVSDLDNVLLKQSGPVIGIYELENIIIEGNAFDAVSRNPTTGLEVQIEGSDTYVMTNLGYLQLKANPGVFNFSIKEGRSSDIYSLVSVDDFESTDFEKKKSAQLSIMTMDGVHIYPRLIKNEGKESEELLLAESSGKDESKPGFFSGLFKKKKHADINIFTIASGHLYERLLSIMTVSVMKHTKHTVKFWLIDNYMSPTFRKFLPHLAKQYGFEYELITYKWPSWLRGQREKQRTIWGYKILFLDVLFPQDLDKVIFVDADQIVRTDMKELVDLDLEGAPYGYTPMGDSRKEMEGFRFWKQGYWAKFLGDKLKYHISALYVIDLKKFRQIAAGDRLRQHYQQLSRDPNSLSNLDQDLPNNLQTQLKIFSLPQDWLWCETWCDDESLKTAKTIDLCNNPLTKEPKLDRARRQIPEWTVYDDEISELHKKVFGIDGCAVCDPVPLLEAAKSEEIIDHDEL